jgi:hypothetical protein
MLPILIDDDQAFQNLDPAYLDRVSQNGDVWVDLYMEPVSRRSYTAEELAGMPPVVFSAGLFSPAWMTEANRRTAERARLGCGVAAMPPLRSHQPSGSSGGPYSGTDAKAFKLT